MSAITELMKLRRQLNANPKKVYPKFDLSEFLFKEQLNFVNDPVKYAVACCSVRAGKTTACAADLIRTAQEMPGTMGLYITLARTSAKAIVWPELKKINRTYGLRGLPNESELTIKFPNDSWIRLYGGNEETEIEKIRGLSNVALVYLDECQAFREHIRELVEDIITKRLYDTNGRCRMIGTPGPVEAGYFYECSKSSGWSQHHWTMFQNPWLLKKSGKTPQELTDEDCKRKGVDHDDPSIQRENYGRWKQDPNALLLNYSRDINHYESLPDDKYQYILGIDLGSRDADALCVLAYSDSSPVTWLVEEIVTPNQLTDDLAKQIRSLEAKYGSMTMVADTGGLGLKVCEDLAARYGFVIEKADKAGKMTDYKFLNNALRTGMFKAKHETRFAGDCNILERDDRKSTPDRIVTRGHSDAVDACLYAFGLSPAYNYTPAKFKALPGTPEYIREQEELHKEALREKIKRENALVNGGPTMGKFHKDQYGRDPWNNWE